MWNRLFIACVLACSCLNVQAAEAKDLKVLFRDGQSFITWQEDASVTGESYRVYRHTKAITTKNLKDATLLLEVKEGSSRFVEMWDKSNTKILSHKKKKADWLIPRLCIEDVGEDNQAKMLAEDTGLVVWTAKEEKETPIYYAVTIVEGGEEQTDIAKGNSYGPVNEQKQDIGAVLFHRQYSKNKKTGENQHTRDWYIMYMDPEKWNVDYIGYAFAFALTKKSFKEGGKAPSAHLDGIGTMCAFSASYANYGSGDFSRNALPTWYFGYGEDIKDRSKKEGGMNTQQRIGNYVQHRFMQTVLFARRKYKITDPRLYINGNSMGASGAIGLAIAYPKFVTAIWANEGYTDYANSGHKNGKKMWNSSQWGNYGKPELANKVKLIPFGDLQLDWYMKHDGMNVYDFRNAAKFLAANVDADFPLMMIGHCHQDGSIPAWSQAYPFEEYIKNSRHCFSYCVSKGGHGWGQAIKGSPMGYLVRWDESRPGFSNVPAVVASKYGKKKDESSRSYALRVQWGVKEKPIDGKFVQETETTWSMPFKHAAKLEKDYFVDITPRNLQALKVKAGDTFEYEIHDLSGKPLAIADFAAYQNGDKAKDTFKNKGTITADKHNLLLIPSVPIDKQGCVVAVSKK